MTNGFTTHFVMLVVLEAIVINSVSKSLGVDPLFRTTARRSLAPLAYFLVLPTCTFFGSPHRVDPLYHSTTLRVQT